MKKIYTLILISLLASVSTFAQVRFFEETTYRGAFGPAASTRWTDGWTNFNPQDVNYAAPTVTISSDITTNTTWTTGTVVLLTKVVYVDSLNTLTIEPGVIIRGDASVVGGTALVISRGAKIIAKGTSTNPIIFTSSESAGNRNIGDWGGLILLGAARINSPSGVAVIEGGLSPAKASYGGNNDEDSSGVVEYVRIEFGGYIFQPDKEINGMTFGGVGSRTVIDHIQCSFTNDDSFEWFGGKVNCRYLVAYRGLDDDFDTDFGFGGKIQFGLIVRDPNIADQSAGSTSEGFESDNDATGTTSTPQTSAVFSNITCIGPYRGDPSNPIDSKFRRALRIRRNSAISVFNSVFTDWPTGLHLDGALTVGNANSGSLDFKHNIFAGIDTGKNLQIAAVDMPLLTNFSSSIYNFFDTNANDSLASSSSINFIYPYPTMDWDSADYRLGVGSPLLTGADFSDPKLDFGVGIKETVGNNISMSIYPNPTSENATLSLDLKKAGKVTVKVYEITGKNILTIANDINLLEGNNKIELNTTDLKPGMYFVTVSNGGFNKTMRLVINK